MDRNKELITLLCAQLNDACWDYREVYSRSQEKSALIEVDSSSIGDNFNPDDADYDWVWDAEFRLEDMRTRISEIREAQGELFNELDRREVNPFRNREFQSAEDRVAWLKKAMRQNIMDLDRGIHSQREEETREYNQEHAILWTLRIAIQKARSGDVDKGYWRWAKKLIAHAKIRRDAEDKADRLSKAAFMKITLGAYTLLKFVAAAKSYDNCEWIEENVTEWRDKLDSYNEEWAEAELPDSIAVEMQRYGLTVAEVEWAVDTKLFGARRPSPTLTYTDQVFLDSVEENEDGWAENLLDELI